MKITYTAPNRAHHYSCVEALNRAGHLYAFISGFSRLSPRSPLPSIGEKLKRYDFYQTLYLASLRFNTPTNLISSLVSLSNKRLDNASMRWAMQSDVFIYYRTQGINTTRRLHSKGSTTLCVMEEVNSHVEFANQLMKEEFDRIGIKNRFIKDSDYDMRLIAYEEADCILCPSEYVRNSFLSKGFSPNRLIKVNYGFPPIEILTSKISQSKKGTFRVLYVGQLNYRKGLRYAIEAFRRLKHPKKEFIIVGPKTVVTGLEKTKIPEGVIFTGVLKGEKLKDQYRNASVFVLPSIDEGLSLVQFEALSFGVPLLITTNTGGDELIRNGFQGFIVPPADTNALYDRLQLMADDNHLLKSMSESALQTACSIGDWDTAADRLVCELRNFIVRNKQ